MDFSDTSIVELAAIVAEHLQQQGIEVVLVGGLAVEIYTDNLYLTKDIDMINTNYKKPAVLHKAMEELGFRKKGRVYINDTTDITVEFPSGPLSVGNEFITRTTFAKIAQRTIPILVIEDVVKDRLAAFIHWNDRQSLVQATAILLNHGLKPAAFKEFCVREGGESGYGLLQSFHRRAIRLEDQSMETLESLLARLLLSELDQ
jgi:hypothetical protein